MSDYRNNEIQGRLTCHGCYLQSASYSLLSCISISMMISFNPLVYIHNFTSHHYDVGICHHDGVSYETYFQINEATPRKLTYTNSYQSDNPSSRCQIFQLMETTTKRGACHNLSLGRLRRLQIDISSSDVCYCQWLFILG